MKKILLLILTSLVCLAGCKKEDPEEGANIIGLEPVTQEYTCPNCGAKYSVTCKKPNIDELSKTFDSIPTWDYHTYGDNWIVKDAAGEIIPHFEYWNREKMYFTCTCGKNSKEFNIDDFKTKIFKP